MKRRLVCILLLGSFAPWLASAATPAPAVRDDARISRLAGALEDVVQAQCVEQGVPGIVAAVVLADGRMVKAACGYADRERDVAMTPDSRMLSGSTGKTFVSALALRLASRGAWSLDAPLSRYLGDRPWFHRLPNADALTVRILLRHRGGIDNYYNNPRFFELLKQRLAEDPSYSPSFDSLIDFVSDRPPLFAAGQGFNYTDVGFLLVGLAMESATHQHYYDLVRAEFIDPLGLTLTSPSTSRRLPGLAQGYARERNPLFQGPLMLTAKGELSYDPAIEFTAGGFVTNAGDLARWAHAAYGGSALSAAERAELTERPGPRQAGDEDKPYYGLGVGVYPPLGGLPAGFGHDGYIPGYRSFMRYFPESGIAVAIQVNSEDGVWDAPAGEGAAAAHLDFKAMQAKVVGAVLGVLRP